jgi:hypothetical protein
VEDVSVNSLGLILNLIEEFPEKSFTKEMKTCIFIPLHIIIGFVTQLFWYGLPVFPRVLEFEPKSSSPGLE